MSGTEENDVALNSEKEGPHLNSFFKKNNPYVKYTHWLKFNLAFTHNMKNPKNKAQIMYIDFIDFHLNCWTEFVKVSKSRFLHL